MIDAVTNESALESGVFGEQYPAGYAPAAFKMSPRAPDEFRIPHAPVPIWFIEVGNRRMRLARPFAVRLSFDGGLYFAENDALAVCAHGNSAGAALSDAILQVIYFYDHYRQLSEHDVIGPAIELRKLYSGLFEVTNAD
jgi:hypothetical protein